MCHPQLVKFGVLHDIDNYILPKLSWISATPHNGLLCFWTVPITLLLPSFIIVIEDGIEIHAVALYILLLLDQFYTIDY